MDAIEFKEVWYSYDGASWALDDLTFEVDRGSFLCVLGGNGSGKSTLARHINALLIPDSGEVRVLDMLTSQSEHLYEIRSNAGLVFQNPDDQIVAAVVEDDVAFGPENLGVPTEELSERVGASLRRVGLAGFEDHETTTLSGGQKQRVAIAGALAMKPQILVFDEASAMLDPRGRRALIRLCRQLNDAGITIVLITHFMEDATQADRVMVLDSGAVAMDGPPVDVLLQVRRLQELALEMPFAARMSLALEEAAVPVKMCVDDEELERQLSALLGEGLPSQESPQEPALSDDRPTPKDAVIELQGVSFSYGGEAGPSRDGDGSWALHDVSFSLEKGGFLGIAGHTGSGKSTLIQLMAGLLNPVSGNVRMNGSALAGVKGTADIRRSVGLVFQYPERQLFARTVYEDVAFGPRNLGLSAEEVEERVRKALELVHLDPDALAQKSPFELSGGQQRRVALAGVLAMRPSVLILDEPAAGLDPEAHRLLLDLIADLHRQGGVAVVMVSHDMDDLARLCDRILVLDHGSVVAHGTPLEVFSDEGFMESLGLGVPHTMHLAARLGIHGRFPRIPTIAELAAVIGDLWKRAQVADQ